MAVLQVEWQLRADADCHHCAPGLRFALITIMNGQASAQIYPNDLDDRRSHQQSTWPRWSGELHQVLRIPTDENPYFAVAVQVYERDLAVANRATDDKNLADSLVSVCQEVVDGGGLPQSRVVQAAAAAPRLDRTGEAGDTWVGAAGWVDVDFGRRIAADLSRESLFDSGEVMGIGIGRTATHRSVVFPTADHTYQLEVEHRVLAGGLDYRSQFSLQGWSSVSWVR